MSATVEAVRERPILFSGPMVRAILDGRKTQTRRALRPQPDGGLDYDPGMVSRFALLGREVRSGKLSFGAYEGARPLNAFPDGPYSIKHEVECPYGAPGDLLWVRESACIAPPGFGYTELSDIRDDAGRQRIVQFVATHPDTGYAHDYGIKVTPSIHMPRWASRLTLRVTDVRVERLQDMTAQDAIDEGTPSRGIDRDHPSIASALMYLDDFKNLWDARNAKRGYGWDANPWVWVISFERVATQPGGVA